MTETRTEYTTTLPQVTPIDRADRLIGNWMRRTWRHPTTEALAELARMIAHTIEEAEETVRAEYEEEPRKQEA